MPRNSRRKRDARQRAARKGERYTRALRIVGSVGPTLPPDEPGEATAGADTWERDIERMRIVQRLLESRGWVVGPYALDGVDDNGLAISPDISWDYPSAFGGRAYDKHHEDDDHPRQPVCTFFWSRATKAMSVVVETAGNWQGCGRHRTVRYALPVTDQGVPGLRELLAQVEEAALAMNPAPLIACTAHGRCGEHSQRRADGRRRKLAWYQAMTNAYSAMTEQQRADLEAWEHEHLGRDDEVGTSDWPGWIPLIGAPPRPDPVPSPENDGVPVDILRPVLDRRDLSIGAKGLWSMLVSYHWCCEPDRTVAQLHEHRPQEIAETDELVQELADASLVRISPRADGEHVVSIDTDALGVVGVDSDT